ncbi:MAG: hypothetical protein HY689_03415 [Chloroflexi bacterium]|nr:hypothetical protein [Chloroflexota bacterium]
MPSSQEQALALFQEMVQDTLVKRGCLSDNLRRGIYACALMGWDAQKERFRAELNGFAGDQVLPWYRQQQHVVTVWRSTVPAMTTFTRMFVEGLLPEYEPKRQDIASGMTQLELVQTTGISYSMSGTKEVYSRLDKANIIFNETLQIPASTIQLILARIMDWCFEFATQACILLEFGSFTEETFNGYRAAVDDKLSAMGLGQSLNAISSNLKSTEPLSWQLAVLGCRALLQKVADVLWRDPRPIYDELRGQGPGGKLQVTQDKYKNRLMAYLHQKGARTSGEDFLSRQLNRLADSVDDLIDLQSKAKAEIAYRDAVLAVVTTYSVLGELCIRTNMQPVTQYEPITY